VYPHAQQRAPTPLRYLHIAQQLDKKKTEETRGSREKRWITVSQTFATITNYLFAAPDTRLFSTCHSHRIADIGSIRAARSAGRREVALAIAVNAATDPTRTHGSLGEVS
jgi:hypothetical protein